MSSLAVYHQSTPDIPNKVLTHFEDIAATLAEHGVRFERWTASAPVQPEEVMVAYQAQIDQLMTERGYRNVEVVSAASDVAMQVVGEVTVAEDVVRVFVAGRGQYALRIEDYVYAVVCEKGDLIVVPAGVRHWFDGGENPHFVALRMFKEQGQAMPQATGDRIAEQFARFDD
ncbi:cupin domain-containing protein [Pseudomonas fontis]|uniref:Acireductone dioxygenase n=1 Tax=Pseudomonas fontis TaxID=2942633 RepID=A0ABT5NVN3_9PSED|nr:cupin domain-containing protein [Pseudomonas fontis]MDD0975512.1 acireductone dioxygenase [Pseudomonas fontis]MDD0992196.1 acireductone dioxygenase [Pseudomonas fontis]